MSMKKEAKLLLAMDGSPFSVACFDDMVKVSDKTGMGFDVIFIEDRRLFGADMPFLRQVSPISLDEDDLPFDEMNLRLQKEAIKRAMDFQSRHVKRNIRLIMKEGKIEEELLKAAADYDALVIGAAGWRTADTHFRTGKIGTRFLFPSLGKSKVSKLVLKVAKQNKGATLVIKRSLMDLDFAAVKEDIKIPEKVKPLFRFLTGTGTVDLKEAGAASVVVIGKKEIEDYQTLNASFLTV